MGTTLTSGVGYRFNNYEANARFTIDPTLFFGMAYTYTSNDISGGPGGSVHVHWNQVNLLVDKFLSKRTSIYTAFARINNEHGAAFTVGNATATGTGDKAFNLGVVHNF